MILYKRKKLILTIINWIMIFPIVIPEGVSRLMPSIYLPIYRYWKRLDYILIFLLLLIIIIQRKVSNITVVIALVMAVSFLCNLLNGKGIYQWEAYFFACFYTYVLVEYNKDNLLSIISIFRILLNSYILINLICIILYPNGMYYSEETNYYQNWFLGYKSSLQYFMIPAFCLNWMESRYSGSRGIFYILSGIFIIEAYLSGNVMLVVGLAISLLIAILNLIQNEKIFNIRNYIIAIVSINIVFIFFNMWFVNTTFGKLVLTILGKGTTLSGRASVIWPITLKEIRKKLLLGHGIWTADERRTLYLGMHGAIHSHNQILEIFFVGGILLGIVYILYHCLLIKQLQKNFEFDSSRILSACIFVIYLMVVVEIFLRNIASPIWLILILSQFCKEIDVQYSEKYRCCPKNKLRRSKIKFKI